MDTEHTATTTVSMILLRECVLNLQNKLRELDSWFNSWPTRNATSLYEFLLFECQYTCLQVSILIIFIFLQEHLFLDSA